MSLADRFKNQPSHDGARLPVAGTELAPIELFRKGPVGPCKATVVADAIRLESGRQRFRVVETWTPPQDGFGEITETTLVDDEFAAWRDARAAVDEWRQGTARSHRLAPNGRLRAPTPALRPGVIPALAPFELVDEHTDD